MKAILANGQAHVGSESDPIRVGGLAIDIPKGHVGPLMLSGTGRTVWWTGRVAIGLRYEQPRYAESFGQSALWIQDVLLQRGASRA